jgi:hypothetical protein
MIRKLLVILFTFLITLPVLVFLIKFWHNPITEDPNVWLAYGASYFGIMSIITTGIIANELSKLEFRNSRVALQFEGYKDLVRVLESLIDIIKINNKTNQDVILQIEITFRELIYFRDNFIFLFAYGKGKKESLDKHFTELQDQLIVICNETRELPSNDRFGANNNGSTIINSAKILLSKVQALMI